MSVRLIALAAATLVASCAPAVAQQKTVSADSFVDSVGVNIHLHYTGTPYFDQFGEIRNKLVELGVRHVRDGLVEPAFPVYYERHASLAQAGIKGTFIANANQGTEALVAFVGRLSDAVEALEGPNEYDVSGQPNWAQTVTETMKRLRGLKSDKRFASIPIYAPSLTTEGAYAALGDISAYFDYANMHNYFAGRHPGTTGWGAGGYGSIVWNLDLNRRYAEGKPIVSTETGYRNDPRAPDSVPDSVAARYMPRMLLEQLWSGVVRTFIYELCDFTNSGGYGLLRSDVTPKPSFYAVQSLLHLLNDPGPSFPIESLRYNVEGGGDGLRHISFQKRNGTYYVALWLAVSSWDVQAQRAIGTQPGQAVIRFDRPVNITGVHRWQGDGTRAKFDESTRTGAFPVTISDTLTIVELTR